MKPEVTFYPVGNGDMTLIKLESDVQILIDINIRQPGDGIRDVASDLRRDVRRDDKGRPYVDVMVLSHPDQDHCRGFEEHFHVGSISEYKDAEDFSKAKIIIKEMWSSPLIFRRSNKKNHSLCSDAKAWATEARRRVMLFREGRVHVGDGDRIRIIGEDVDGKTDDIQQIVTKAGGTITTIADRHHNNFSAYVIAPMLADDDNEDELLGKNESSIIMNYSIGYSSTTEAAKFLSGGDAEVVIWEKVWEEHKGNVTPLQYNLMSTPHHCSWHTLSHDSSSELKDKAKVSDDALSALSQTLPGATIVASSKEILDNEDDPPSYRAKGEYVKIAKNANGEFWSVGSYLSPEQQTPLIFEVSTGGLKRIVRSTGSGAGGAGAGGAGLMGTTPLQHG